MDRTEQVAKKNSRMDKILKHIEKTGNKLPHPVVMFFYFTIGTYLLSFVLAKLGTNVSFEAIKDGQLITQEVYVKNLLSIEGIRNLFVQAIPQFVGHPAIGTILIAMLGVGVADKSGLIDASIKRTVMGVPKWAITPVVVFAGIMSNLAADAGYVVLIPLGAIIFMGFGRHPLAGIAAAFAGVSGGFSANLLVGTVDSIMAGITEPAAQIIDSSYKVDIMSNWYFIIASTFLITLVGWWVTDKVVEPALGKYKGNKETNEENNFELTTLEKRGLKYTLFSTIAFLVFLYIMTRGGMPLGKYQVGEAIIDPFMQSIVLILSSFFLVIGVAFGFGSKKMNSSVDIVNGLVEAMKSCASVLVIIFISAQFIYAFKESNIGSIIAVKGAEFLEGTGLEGTLLMVMFIFITALINLFMGGLTSKWLMMSPVFVPLFMRLGYSPEYTMLAYRIGDSTTNIISPLMTYFPIIIAFAEKYKKKGEDLGLGTIISMMLPYSVAFLIAWTLLFVLWSLLGLPIGPDTITTYKMI